MTAAEKERLEFLKAVTYVTVLHNVNRGYLVEMKYDFFTAWV